MGSSCSRSERTCFDPDKTCTLEVVEHKWPCSAITLHQISSHPGSNIFPHLARLTDGLRSISVSDAAFRSSMQCYFFSIISNVLPICSSNITWSIFTMNYQSTNQLKKTIQYNIKWGCPDSFQHYTRNMMTSHRRGVNQVRIIIGWFSRALFFSWPKSC